MQILREIQVIKHLIVTLEQEKSFWNRLFSR
ncbi:DUF3967 domain-containing protein [Bacillus thuringiensis]